MNITAPKLLSLYVHLVGTVMLSLALLTAQAEAQDADNDGFSDSIEQTGFNLSPGLTNVDGTPAVSLCGAVAPATDPCVHPSGPDLFVILIPAIPAASSLIPSNPLVILPNLLSGLLGAHQLTQANPPPATGRIVTPLSAENAVSVAESLDQNGTNWGQSPFQGTPNSAGLATVFTKRIAIAIDNAYTQANADRTSQKPNTDNCIRQAIAHETGHNTLIATQYNSRYGGYHYSTSSQVVMSQTATIVTKPGKVTIVCPTTYASPDATGFKLK